MNRVQELIDENKEQMPTALAKVPLDACKQEADNTKQLYKLTWTMVGAPPAPNGFTSPPTLDLSRPSLPSLTEH